MTRESATSNEMGRTLGGIAAVVALAAVAFCAAYFGGGALNKPPVAQATSGGAALHAPELATTSQPVALRTPTATPFADGHAQAEEEAHAQHKKSAPKKKVDDLQAAEAHARPDPGRHYRPTAVYHPPACSASSRREEEVRRLRRRHHRGLEQRGERGA